MEHRKRKSALENYLDGLEDPPEKVKKMSDFYNRLQQFYKRKWNAPLRLPCIQGVEVNLFRLYDTVMSMGGWQKVAHQEKWPDVAEMLGIGEDVVGGDHAIKLIYMRYLSKFEQTETVGDIDDMMMDGELSRSRGRQVSYFATNECPISHARAHEYIRRDERGNPSTEPDYARVIRSLLSGLPNEVDFGVNVCTLLSHPGPRLLRLSHAPNIPTILVAHCGVFDDGDADLSDLYETWQKVSGRDFMAFWANSGVPKEFLEKFVAPATSKHVDSDGELLSGLNVDYDVRNPISWRLNQIVTIIRNFSFEPINRVTLTQNWPLMKFLFLCASCKWVPLYTAAMDTLSNIACDINLASHSMTHLADHALLRILKDGIMSNDKFKLIRSMEILTGLSMSESNEEILCDFIKLEMFEKILNVVCVKDIMMCVYALECLYQVSEMGDGACDVLVRVPRCIQQLVSMATLEAVSFGPAGLAGMKVVEYQPAPGTVLHHNQMQQQGPGMHPIQNMQHPHPGAHPQPHSVMQTPQHQQQRVPFNPAGSVHRVPGMSGTIMQQPLTATPQHRAGPPSTMGTPHMGGAGGETKVDQLTEQWIRANCHADRSAVTPRGELYAAYVDDLRNQYHSLSGSLAMFSNVMRQIHPEVQFKMAENGLMMVAQGIRLVKPHKLAPTALSTVSTPGSASMSAPSPSANLSSHPLMKQILTKPPPIPTTTPVNGFTTNGKITISTESSRSHSPMEEAPAQTSSEAVSEPKETPSTPEVKSEVARRILMETAQQNGTVNGEVKPSPSESAVVPEKKEEPVEQPRSDTQIPPTTPTPDRQTPVLAATPQPVAEYMCEWDGCGRLFSSSNGILIHISSDHMIDGQMLPCKWPGCDGTPRSKWSLVTHIQDHHVQEHQLKAALQKRRDGLAPSRPVPYRTDIHRDIPQHPGYAKHAAIDAIRRHAFNFLPRDITDEPEGPVTKSIRLTSSLILRNIARYSAEGRHLLRRHEAHLCWLALSRLESSHALAQLLSELQPVLKEEEEAEKVEEQTTPPTSVVV